MDKSDHAHSKHVLNETPITMSLLIFRFALPFSGLKLLFCLLAFLSGMQSISAQDILADSIIAIYEDDSPGHSKKEAEFLFRNNLGDDFYYHTLLPRLRQVYKRRPSSRLKIHLLFLEGTNLSYLDNFNEQRGIHPRSIEMMREAIDLSSRQKDGYLLAETYLEWAEVYNFYHRHSEYLAMLVKAFKIIDGLDKRYLLDRKLYSKHFGMCKALFKAFAYRECLDIGYRALNIRTRYQDNSDVPWDIQLLDLMGASYKRLGMPDSSTYFYNKIIEKLNDENSVHYEKKELWNAIANGNIGENLTTKGNLTEGRPLLKNWLSMAVRSDDMWNILLSKSALAKNSYAMGRYHEAYRYWRDVYDFCITSPHDEHVYASAMGLSDVFRSLGQTDSLYYYAKQTQLYQDKIASFKHKFGVDVIESRVALEDLEHSLQETLASLEKEKRTKQAFLLGSILLLTIAVLLYRVQRLKSTNLLQQAIFEKEKAHREIETAKGQLDLFVDSLREKSSMIEELQKKIQADEKKPLDMDIYEDLYSNPLITESEWQKFRANFMKVYPQFLPRVTAKLPNISPAEERLSILIFLGLGGSQIAFTLGIGRKSVTRARYRLALRFNLEDTSLLDSFIGNMLISNR